jgi:PAS domain S-box-containing protein
VAVGDEDFELENWGAVAILEPVSPEVDDLKERKVGILLVEDNEDDAYFILAELKKGGIAHVAKCVSRREEFISALAEFEPDLVLSDYKLPEFAEMEPLRLVREKSPDLPFILVTGALGEELSVEVIKQGATDYILKDRLFRLAPSVKRALRETEERRRRREADELLKKQHEQLQRQNVALQESEERFRQLAENIREVFWMTDTQKNETIYVSPGYESIWGRSCRRLYETARDWVEAIHREDRERVLQAALEKQVRGEYDEVYRIVRPDGSIRWIHDRAFPVRNEAGEVYRVTGIAEDITERKMAERRLEARNEVIKALAVSGTLREAGEKILESIGKCLEWDFGAFWEVEGEPKVLRCLTLWRSVEGPTEEFVNAIQNKSYGMGEEFPGHIWKLGRAVWRPNADEETSFVFPRARIAARCGLHGAFGFPILVRDEVVGVVEFFSRQIREPDKALLEMVSALGHQIGQFISRKHAEEGLREAEENYRSIYEHAMEGIFQTTPEGRYLSANPALARMLGYGSPEELIASVREIGSEMCVRAESRLKLKKRLEAEGQVRGFENQIRRKDGRVIWISVNAHIVRDAEGKVLYYEGTSQDITERKRAEEALKESEARLAKLAHAVESTAEMICITDMEDRFTFANPAFLKGYGYTEAEIIGKTPVILFSPHNPPELLGEILRETRAGGWNGEVIDRRKDGTDFPISLGTSQIRNSEGEVIGLIGVARDITERKCAERQNTALSTLSHRLSSATTPKAAAEIIMNTASNLIGWDAGYVDLYAPAGDKTNLVLLMDTIDGKRVTVDPPDSIVDPTPLMQLVTKEGAKLVNVNDDVVTGIGVPFGDTERRSASKMYVPIRSGGKTLGVLSIQSYRPQAYSEQDLKLLQTLADRCGDALQRIEITEALREAEANYRGIFENATEGIFQSTTDGRLLSANPALARMFGHETAAELILAGSDIGGQAYVRPERRAELKQLLERDGMVKGFEAECYRKDRTKFWISVNGHVVRDAEGRIHYHEGTAQDVTERKRAETVLKESEEKFRTLFESAPIGMALHDARGKYLQTNQAYQRMLGFSDIELRQLSVRRITHPDDVLEGQRFFEEFREGKREQYQREKRYVHKDGHLVWAQASASAIRNSKGELIYIISMVEDITERKQLEQEVIETSANERRRVGHELHDGLGQYLAGIAFKAKALEQCLVAESLPHGAEAKELAALVSNAISQTRSLARGLDPIEVETIGLQAALQNLAVETQKFFNISCRFQCSENELEVDPQVSLTLYRVVQEAIHNGITHGEAGAIEIELSMNGANLCLRVQDDGTGFQPEGSRPGGIGLRVMQYRARSIGGSLRVSSEPQRGTEVHCMVPRRRGWSAKVNEKGIGEGENGDGEQFRVV